MPRRAAGAMTALLVAVGPLAGAAGAAGAEPVPTLVIEGRGFGHGVGLPQDGAFAMASAGASASSILRRFYPGTSLGRRAASVRVGVHEASGPVVVVLPAGGEVRDAASGPQSPGFPVTVNPGGSVRFSFDGSKYRALPLAGATITAVPAAAPAPAAPAPAAAPPPTAPPTTNLLDPLLQTLLPTTVPPTTAPRGPVTGSPPPVPAAPKDAASPRGLWAIPRGDALVSVPAIGRSYRGTIRAGVGGPGLQLTNELDVEQYLRGLGEMPASWPAAALQAQAIAARTFALRAAAAGRTLCDDQQCQVYIGAGNEHPSTSAAATVTRGQVLLYQGALAETVYSASAGGMAATAEEGFGPGSPDLPYLQPVAYEVADPLLWAMTLPLDAAAARFGYRGELRAVTVSRTGPSGRPLDITFDGSDGPITIDAHRFWAELKLRSTLYTLRTEVAEPVVDGEPLAALTPDLPPGSELAGPVGAAVPALDTLGRAPWVGVAVLLLAVWATAANRVAGRHATPAPAPSNDVGRSPRR